MRTAHSTRTSAVNAATSSQLTPGRPAAGSNADPNFNRTAHWGTDGIFYRWSDGGIEATAFALRAMLAVDPQNKLIEPVANWLIKNRRGAQWSNTRDTAIVLLAVSRGVRHIAGSVGGSLSRIHGRARVRRRRLRRR